MVVAERNPRLSNTERAKRYREAHPERYREIRRLYDKLHFEEICDAKKRLNLALKEDTLSYYSKGEPFCTICGERRLACLSIDHINGGGEMHRRSLGMSGGASFYRWLRKNSYPSGYQVLCMNCQWIKRQNNNEHR